jgi:hypothetical protein
MVTGTARPTMSIHAGVSAPPTPVITTSMASMSASVSHGQVGASHIAAAASTANGTRSQMV